ncbi:MAG: lincosamide nucleotidyltransferase [Actinomycetota bacterium]|jgi:lincosamide nucleotidyltransferase A/C/D/E|nr:lincosamide nucleotidyltransferase [Actinomycetota bacterium]
MDAHTVVELLARLSTAGVDVWIGGGWGVDALLGRQTRPHRDLDLMHDLEYEHLLVSVLKENGYAETFDARPVRFVMTRATGIELDLHPLVFAADGSARQAADDLGATFTYPAECFVTGRVLRTVVPCLSAAQQVYFHQGYEPRERDLHDMARLREAFGISTHF